MVALRAYNSLLSQILTRQFYFIGNYWFSKLKVIFSRFANFTNNSNNLGIRHWDNTPRPREEENALKRDGNGATTPKRKSLNPFVNSDGDRGGHSDGTADSRNGQDVASGASWSGDEDAVNAVSGGDYKSLSKLNGNDDEIGQIVTTTTKGMTENDDKMTVTDGGGSNHSDEGAKADPTEIGDDAQPAQQLRALRFGGAQIGRLTKSMGGRSSGDVITLGDIVEQYRLVIKEAARAKLIRNYAAKQGVEQFESRQHIYGLLEVVILLVIKFKFKENVDFEKARFATELEDVVEWIVSGEDAMNGRAWNVDEFADHFDEWISTISTLQ